MKMLIDTSYFTKGVRQVMNAVDEPKNANETAVKARIEGYIQSLEMEYLNLMLGKVLSLSVARALKEEAADDLPVLKYVAEKLKEPFANYVFYHILNDMNHTATITGIVQLKCSNSYVSPIKRQVSVWNTMVDMNREFVDWARTGECPFKVQVSSNMLTYINTLNL